MLYHVPPDNPEDATEDSQKVFIWLVRSEVEGMTLTDDRCLDASKRLFRSVCIRAVMAKARNVTNFLVYAKSDMAFLVQDGRVLWEEYRPSQEMINSKMLEAIDMRENKVIPLPYSPPKKLHIEGFVSMMRTKSLPKNSALPSGFRRRSRCILF